MWVCVCESGALFCIGWRKISEMLLGPPPRTPPPPIRQGCDLGRDLRKRVGVGERSRMAPAGARWDRRAAHTAVHRPEPFRTRGRLGLPFFGDLYKVCSPKGEGSPGCLCLVGKGGCTNLNASQQALRRARSHQPWNKATQLPAPQVSSVLNQSAFWCIRIHPTTMLSCSIHKGILSLHQ